MFTVFAILGLLALAYGAMHGTLMLVSPRLYIEFRRRLARLEFRPSIGPKEEIPKTVIGQVQMRAVGAVLLAATFMFAWILVEKIFGL
jgi:hypothetical protein